MESEQKSPLDLPQLNALSHNNASDDQKLWKMMEKTLLQGIIEQRRARRWGIFFKLISLVFVGFFILGIFGISAGIMGISSKDGSFIEDFEQSVNNEPTSSDRKYTAVIELDGVIADKEKASASNLNSALRAAFADPRVEGIILQINSGGGSPVQSAYVYDEIKRLRKLYPSTKVYAVIADIGASGAYFIASAADEIYANKASLVGSIGVTAASFGFTNAMEKVGVERRLYTAGEHKAFLDPFSPMNQVETTFWKKTLGNVHNQFIQAVKNGRGARLKVNENPDLFSGLIWDGESALTIGLIDGFGSASSVARDIIGASKMKNFTRTGDPFEHFLKRMGVSVKSEILSTLTTPKLQ